MYDGTIGDAPIQLNIYNAVIRNKDLWVCYNEVFKLQSITTLLGHRKVNNNNTITIMLRHEQPSQNKTPPPPLATALTPVLWQIIDLAGVDTIANNHIRPNTADNCTISMQQRQTKLEKRSARTVRDTLTAPETVRCAGPTGATPWSVPASTNTLKKSGSRSPKTAGQMISDCPDILLPLDGDGVC